jgi:colanic acid biosynthesis glycosyl transferase WcaI
MSGVLRELVRCGHQIEVVTALPNYPMGRIYREYKRRILRSDDWQGMRVHRVWLYASMGSGIARYLSHLSFTVTSLLGLLKCKAPDLILVESPPPLLAICGVIASRWWSVPVILNVADLWPDSAVEFGLIQPGLLLTALKHVEAWAYRHVTLVSAVTEGIRQRLIDEKRLPRSKVLFLPNGVDVEIHRPITRDSDLSRRLGLEDKITLLYAGNVGYAHAAEKFLYAARVIADPRLHFLFVGGGSSSNDLRKIAAQLNLKNVSFLDSVSANEVTRLFSLAYCGLASVRSCTIMNGARPAKILAAMACGKPVVYAGDGEGARLVEQGGGGIVVRNQEPVALANAILRLVADEALACRLGRAGRYFVTEHLTWRRLVKQWLDELSVGLRGYVPFDHTSNKYPS